jgi:hypothetical protein
VDELGAELINKDLQIAQLNEQINFCNRELKNQKGLYLGGGIGYHNFNSPNIETMIILKFDKSAVYLSGLYGGYLDINIGYLYKIQIRR